MFESVRFIKFFLHFLFLMTSFKGLKQRRLCNRCGRRTTLKKIFFDNGGVVVRCLSCGGEHVLRRPYVKKFLNKKGGLGYILIFVVLLSLVIGAFLFFRGGEKEKDDDLQVLNHTVYPIRFRTSADFDVNYNLYSTKIIDGSAGDKLTLKNITSMYEKAIVSQDDNNVMVAKFDRVILFYKEHGKYFDSISLRRGKLVDTGVLRPGVIESFQKTEFNTSYILNVVGSKHYFLEVVCRPISDDFVCDIDPERIADLEIHYSNGTLFLNADNGYVNDALLCLAWKGSIVSVEIKSLNRTSIPERLFNLVDRCYFLGDFRGRSEWPVNIRRLEPGGTNITFFIIDKARMGDSELGYEEDSGMKDLVYEVNV